MRSNVAWIGLSVFSLLGAALFPACGQKTSEVGQAYPLGGNECATLGETAAAADGCNECTCAPSPGKDARWVCTDRACSGGGGNDGGAGACSPGDRKTVDCNECDCTGDGTWACTDKACTGTLCTPGERMRKDDCNDCICSDGGDSWQCTGAICIDRCSDGDELRIDCNTCTCASGQWGCTQAACGCEPGDTMNDFCNQCTCNDQGTWSCTDERCELAPGTQCWPGSIRYEDCNICTCLGDGTWVCSDKDCTPECTEGETRRNRCNVCTCSGGEWACDDAACDKVCEIVGEVYATDGGCSGCRCNKDGQWDCWTNACATPEACTVEGEERVACLDCKCDAGGQLDCDAKGCNELYR